jgi:hypothetical protein
MIVVSSESQHRSVPLSQGTMCGISQQTSLVSDSHKFQPSSPSPETEIDGQCEDYTERDIAVKQALTQAFLQMIKCTTLAIGK